MSFHCDSLVLVLFCLCVCFLCCFLFFGCGFVACFVFLVAVFLLFSPWNYIISVHHEPEAYYSIGFYCRIHTASKYLHNDLARAIKALEQKKLTQGTSKFSAQDWVEQSLTQIGTCWLHVKKRRMSMDPR